MNCSKQDHGAQLLSLCDTIFNSIIRSGRPLCKPKNNTYADKPGWNAFVEEAHTEARQAFKAWAVAGKPRSGSVFEHKKRANAKFKYALRYIKTNENTLRADSLASNLQNSYNDFWKEVRMLNSSRSSI